MKHSTAKPPTILDIARVTGLSKSVVSRALNGEPGVSTESRRAVADAARQMGYVANAMASRMRSQRVDTVGVLVRDPASPFYGALLGALQSNASQRGVRLITMTGSGQPDLEEERAALRALLALRVDGLLVCSGLLPASDLYPFAERLPTVVVGRSEWDDRISSVACDDEDGSRKIVNFVAQLGRTDLLIPMVPAAAAPTLHIRANLFVAMARTLGLAPSTVEVSDPGQLIARLADRSVSTVLAPNDRWAVACLEALAPRRDVLVTGYDGVGVYGSPLLGLTTIVQPVADIASRALELIVDLLLNESSPAHVALPGELRVGTRGL